MVTHVPFDQLINAIYIRIVMPAILRQDSAQRRQISVHSFICASSPNCSQLSAQCSQTSAHTPHTRGCTSDPRNMKSALVTQIWAQSRKRRRCVGSACFPPISVQYVTVS